MNQRKDSYRAALRRGQDIAVPLEGSVQSGARVLVTVEKAGGVDAPTQKPILSVQS